MGAWGTQQGNHLSLIILRYLWNHELYRLLKKNENKKIGLVHMIYLQTASSEDVCPPLPSLSPSVPEPDYRTAPILVGGWPPPPSPLSVAFSSSKVVEATSCKELSQKHGNASLPHHPVSMAPLATMKGSTCTYVRAESGVWGLEGPSPSPGAADL